MPNIVGYSSRDFYSFINLVRIPYTVDGIGYVKEQSIPKDTVLDDKSQLDVKMSAKY